MEMPPLPEELTALFNADRATKAEMERLIRDYGESCARMAREEAAKLCDALHQSFLDGAKQSRGDGEFGEGQWAEWNAQGAAACAAAIRKG